MLKPLAATAELRDLDVPQPEGLIEMIKIGKTQTP